MVEERSARRYLPRSRWDSRPEAGRIQLRGRGGTARAHPGTSNCVPLPILRTASPRVNCAPPTCRICLSPMSPTIKPPSWRGSWTASDCAPGGSSFARGADCLHGHGVLQTRHHRNQDLHALAGGGTGRAPAGVRSAAEAERHGLPQQLRPALDCRRRHRGQEDQSGRQVGGRLLLLRRVAPWAATKASRAPSAIAAQQPRFRTPSSACCAPIWTGDFKAKTCASFSLATRDEELRTFLAGARDGFRRPRSLARACPARRGGVILSSEENSGRNTYGEEGSSMLEFWIGAAGGILIGSTGAGLGLLVTPLLILAGYSPAVAVGTGLGVSVVTKLFGAVVHDRLGHWPGREVWILLAGGVAGVALAWCFASAVLLPSQIDFDTWLKRALAVMLFLAAVAMLKIDRARGRRLVGNGRSRALLLPIGLGVGTLQALTSAGSGSLLTPSWPRRQTGKCLRWRRSATFSGLWWGH